MRKEWKYKTTNYRKAWNDYRKSKEYCNSIATLKAKGIKQPYSSNILQNAFSAAWRASGVEIDWLKNDNVK
jgi:hypothetical protein